MHARLGVVLSPDGGALRQLLLPAKLGLGATLGTGEQWVSFITRLDVLHSLEFILNSDSLTGPINLCAPNPIRQKELIQLLTASLHRKAFLTLPPRSFSFYLGKWEKKCS